jgi:hypothetical protein
MKISPFTHCIERYRSHSRFSCDGSEGKRRQRILVGMQNEYEVLLLQDFVRSDVLYRQFITRQEQFICIHKPVHAQSLKIVLVVKKQNFIIYLL